jgi:Domain of Unknown Function with PDB structure (DUF3857)/Transglutaminase-like superfamily
MRVFRVPSLRILVLVSLLCLCVPFCGAREKPQPAPAWAVDAAKTPTPDSMTHASAVVLFDEHLITVNDKNQAVERERQAIRVLKPQGRHYTHCSIDYDVDEKLNYFRSWTFTPDGRQLQAMETDFEDRGAYAAPVLQFTERIRTVNPPGADPGSVVVCETEEQLRSYISEEEWEIQPSIPVVFEALELSLPPGGRYADSWSRFASVKPTEVGANQLRWELRNIPGLDLENLHATPSWYALAARMSVKWGDSAIQGTDAQWRQLGLWEQGLEEHRPDPTPEIASKARELTAGSTDLYSKLSHITEYIQNNIRYFVVAKGIGGWQAHEASSIFRNGYGDCKDKTTLLIAMLRAADIRAYYFHVDSRRGVIDPSAPSLVGNHMITAIELPEGQADPRLMARVTERNGKTLLIFDPTDEETPVGLTRPALQGAWGNISDGADSQVLQMPVLPPASAGLVRVGSFSLSPDGALQGNLQESWTGSDASSERRFLKEADPKAVRDSLERGLVGDLPNVAFRGFEFKDESILSQPLRLGLNFDASNFADPSGPLLLLRPRVLGNRNFLPPVSAEDKQRTYPIEIGHPGRWRDSFDISLPEGYVVDEVPNPIDVDTDFASYHSSIQVEGNVIHYKSEYFVRQVEIPAAQLASLERLERRILEDERGTVVLKKR